MHHYHFYEDAAPWPSPLPSYLLVWEVGHVSETEGEPHHTLRLPHLLGLRGQGAVLHANATRNRHVLSLTSHLPPDGGRPDLGVVLVGVGVQVEAVHVALDTADAPQGVKTHQHQGEEEEEEWLLLRLVAVALSSGSRSGTRVLSATSSCSPAAR